MSESQREVWEHLSDGKKEQAARACARLEESEQKDLIRKLDQMDREDLRAGFKAAIQRDVGEAQGGLSGILSGTVSKPGSGPRRRPGP
ncbi:hypothetical protein [Salinibacter ruber]|uniref:hypothetical protein n=1 Tax=Salinibacter ruber TaxID=146919 RepID=UPI002167EE3B|nr:hypothetical protein [Salinibacter ruber]MCS3785460.1 hypothetical protein [Salinibacter ruber]